MKFLLAIRNTEDKSKNILDIGWSVKFLIRGGLKFPNRLVESPNHYSGLNINPPLGLTMNEFF